MGKTKKRKNIVEVGNLIDESSTILVGPFIGELSWEIYRFAPYIIFLKKKYPDKKIIIFTRRERFDLYGRYADILVPLGLPDDEDIKQYCFTVKGFNKENYIFLINEFKKKYTNENDKFFHIYPSIKIFNYKLRWQFPRFLMDYDFKPRFLNRNIVEEYVKDVNKLVLVNRTYIKEDLYNLVDKGYKLIYTDSFFEDIEKRIEEGNCSFLGCMIELIKKCDFVLSKINSPYGILSLLLKTPVISVDKNISEDLISLLNPYKTQAIVCDIIEKGFEYYENNF